MLDSELIRQETGNGISGDRNSTLQRYKRGRGYDSAVRRASGARIKAVPHTLCLLRIFLENEQRHGSFVHLNKAQVLACL